MRRILCFLGIQSYGPRTMDAHYEGEFDHCDFTIQVATCQCCKKVQSYVVRKENPKAVIHFNTIARG